MSVAQQNISTAADLREKWFERKISNNMMDSNPVACLASPPVPLPSWESDNADLAGNLERVGLEQYLDAFIEEGFDTWETLLDVQESDLETLGVKLGHRRKLQRAIADYRGITYERLVGSPVTQDGVHEPARPVEGSQSATGKEGASAPPAETKRRYRRHPKPDENAPEKPPSAYVLFSNKVREEVRSENLSFTEIAKLVGDRWQKLDPTQKEPFESQATSLKEQYNIQLSAYKKTDAHKEYTQYLTEFKAKHGPQTESKRPKLDPQSSGGSASAASTEVADALPAVPRHDRVGSVSSVSAASLTSGMTSPPGTSMVLGPPMPSIASAHGRPLATMQRATSPQSLHFSRERRFPGQLSSHSSLSDDSGHVPLDPLTRTATLSLNTPPAATPPLPSHSLGSARSDQGGLGESFSWPSRGVSSLHHPGSTVSSGAITIGSGITLPSPTIPSDTWRERSIEWTRPGQVTSSTQGGLQTAALPLPSLLATDRISELGHQRILPPLRPNASSGLAQSVYQSPGSAAQLSHPSSSEIDTRYAQSHQGGMALLNPHENEAASTLAGLSSRPGSNTPESRGHNRR